MRTDKENNIERKIVASEKKEDKSERIWADSIAFVHMLLIATTELEHRDCNTEWCQKK